MMVCPRVVAILGYFFVAPMYAEYLPGNDRMGYDEVLSFIEPGVFAWQISQACSDVGASEWACLSRCYLLFETRNPLAKFISALVLIILFQ